MSDDLDRWLAEKVMGWKYFKSWLGEGFEVDNRDGTHRLIWIEAWHPTRDIAQAMMCLNKFDCWEIRKYHRNDYRCRINDETLVEGPRAETPELAICHAIRQAVEGGEG